MMPTRRRTRARTQNRAHYIATERRHNRETRHNRENPQPTYDTITVGPAPPDDDPPPF